MHSGDKVFIGIPDLARKLHRSRQDTHYRARNGLLPITAYPLRRNRQLTYIFDEKEVDEYLLSRCLKCKKKMTYISEDIGWECLACLPVYPPENSNA